MKTGLHTTGCFLPWSFPLENESFSYLKNLRDRTGDNATAVEFRHRQWYSKDVIEQVLEMGFTPVSLDLSDIPDLPETGLFTGHNAACLRLHGRNSDNWRGNTQQRYDYLYTDAEMATWTRSFKRLSKGVNSCYVFFNNCYMGKAALNAADMERLLEVNP